MSASDCGQALSHSAVPGDLNADGQFTSADYDIVAASILAGGIGSPAAADCFADGSVNVLDGVCVTKKIAAAGNTVTSTGNYRNYLTDYVYNANGAMVSGAGRTFTYTAFNKILTVESNSGYSKFGTTTGDVSYLGYNPERMRVMQTTRKGLNIYLDPSNTGGKLFEVEYNADTGTKYKHYIGGMLATYEIHDDTLNVKDSTRYFLQDHLGSIDVITDASGNSIERLSFDAFGQRRNATTWQAATEPVASLNTHHGYTGHEHLDNVGIIHMNGRLYDPILGRFLSADPNIQAPKNSQSLNRYSYVLNNPLSFTDPSGYFLKGLANFVKKYWRTIVAVAIVVFMPYLAPMLGQVGAFLANPMVTGFISGMVASGGDYKVAAISAFSAGMFQAIGGQTMGPFERAFAHGMAGGMTSQMQGGKFSRGFASGMVTQAFFQISDNRGWTNANGSRVQNATIAAVVGGTTAAIGGGKFANGAVTGAFSRFFNDLAVHSELSASQRKEVGGQMAEAARGWRKFINDMSQEEFADYFDVSIDTVGARRFQMNDDLRRMIVSGELSKVGNGAIEFGLHVTDIASNVG